MAMQVTPHEFLIPVGGSEYRLSPTFSAITDIESRSGKGINAILQTIIAGQFSVTDLVTIVWAGVRANYRANKLNLKDMPTWEKLGDEIQSAGYPSVINSLTDFLTALVNGTQAIQSGESNGEAEKN